MLGKTAALCLWVYKYIKESSGRSWQGCTLQHPAAEKALELHCAALWKSDYSARCCFSGCSASVSRGDPTLMTRSMVTGAWGIAGKNGRVLGGGGGVGKPWWGVVKDRWLHFACFSFHFPFILPPRCLCSSCLWFHLCRWGWQTQNGTWSTALWQEAVSVLPCRWSPLKRGWVDDR